MKFLTTLGKILSTVATVAGEVLGLPGIANLFASNSTAQKVETTFVDKLDKAINLVVTAEGMFQAAFGPDQKNGAQKLAAATPFVANLIKTSEALVGKTIKNEDLFIRGCSEITGGLADVLNAYESPAAPPPPPPAA